METILYGLGALLTCALAWGSGRPGLQKLGLLLLFSCAVSNLAFGLFKPPVLVALNAAQDTCLFAVALLVMKRHEAARKLAWPLSLTFIGMGVFHVIALIAKPATFGSYFTGINVLFALQLLSVGGWAGVECLRNLPVYRFGGTPDHRHSGHGRR